MSTRLGRLLLSVAAVLVASSAYGSSPAKPAGKGTRAADTSKKAETKRPQANTAKKDGTVAKSGSTKRTGVKAQLISVELSIVEKTNAERVQHGLAPLAVDDRLMKSARRHATWMTNAHSLQHTSAPVAENIAMGQRNPREAVRSWMNSPGHRANILNRRYRRIGVAAYRTRSGTTYWCQQFLW